MCWASLRPGLDDHARATHSHRQFAELEPSPAVIPIYLLLALLLGMVAYVIHKVRLGVSRTYRIYTEL